MDIKENWRSMRIGDPSVNQFESAMSGRRLTALERLRRSYRRFATVGTIMTVFPICFALGSHYKDLFGDNLVIFCALWSLYFATCAIMDSWLYFGISKININTMTVSEVVRMAMYYRKRHLQFIAILLPWALALVGWFAYMLVDDKYMLLSILIGLIAGVCIGVRKLMEFLSDYREIREE